MAPELKFTSDVQRNQFYYWIGRRNITQEVNLVGEFKMPQELNETPKILKVLIVTGEPLYIILEEKGGQIVSADFSEGAKNKMGNEGVIFEQGKDPHQMMPSGGSLES